MCPRVEVDSSALLTHIVTADVGQLRASAPARASAMTQQGSAMELVHVLSSGDALMSTGVAGTHEGSLVLHGTIGPFMYEIEIEVRLDVNGEVTVRLHVRKPIELGPHDWKFNLTGIIRDPVSNTIVGAAGLAPSPNLKGAKLDFWCVLRCGGQAILKVLLECLPSLIGGPKAFIACVVSKLGDAGAKVADCIATKCNP